MHEITSPAVELSLGALWVLMAAAVVVVAVRLRRRGGLPRPGRTLAAGLVTLLVGLLYTGNIGFPALGLALTVFSLIAWVPRHRRVA